MLEIELRCSMCGSVLKGGFTNIRDKHHYFVDPCNKCLDTAKQRGRDEVECEEVSSNG